MKPSNMTTSLRKELDRCNISWTDHTEFYENGIYVKYVERTNVDPVDEFDRIPSRACVISYGWVMDCKTKEKTSTKGYPEALEIWCPEYYSEPTGVALNDILKLVVERRNRG